MTAVNRVADYALQIAFNEDVSGIFYIDTSDLAGTDGLSDVGLFSGTFDDVTDDVVGDVTVVAGTDSLAGAVQAGNLTVELLHPTDLSRWNPNNPSSPLNTVTPGFVPMRPVKLTATQDSTTYGVFYGFVRRADWKSDSCSCELYCEDLLLWASRVFPTIAATGATTTGAAIGLILDAIGWTDATMRSLDTGDSIPNFVAAGTVSALQLISDLLSAERGTVYVRGDGVVVYENRSTVQTRVSSWTLDDELNDQDSSIDLDAIFTRVTVTPTATGNANVAINSAAEKVYGRADMSGITTDYIPSDAVASALATDLLYDVATGRPPITVDVDIDSAATLQMILTSPLLSVFTVSETLGNTTGVFVVERITHTIRSQYHAVQYLLTKRVSTTFTVDTTAIDGSDGSVLRY